MTKAWGVLLAVGVLLAGRAGAEEETPLKTDADRQAYAVGIDLARKLKKQGVLPAADALTRGIRDELTGAKLRLTEDELRTALYGYATELKERRARLVGTVVQDNKKLGDAFLAENKTKEGVVALPSGLQYKVLAEGSGLKPKDTDTVAAHYRISLLDGNDFDNSYSRGIPANIKVAEAIPGLKEGLQLMPVGSKWQLFIPSNLAYGEKGLSLGRREGRKIAPDETLIYEVELLSIQ